MDQSAEYIPPEEKPPEKLPDRICKDGTNRPWLQRGKPKGTLSRPAREAVKLAVSCETPLIEAYQAITGRKPTPGTLQRMEDKIPAWSLHHPTAQRTASQTIRKFAKGVEVNGIKPKDSTVLSAAARIIDSEDPIVKRSVNLTGELRDFMPFDPSDYL